MKLYHGSNTRIHTIATLFRNFSDGIIDLPMLVNGLKYRKVSSQYFFHTLKAVTYLKML